MKRSIPILWLALATSALGSLGCTVTAEPVRVAAPVEVVAQTPTVAYAEIGVAPIEMDIATYPQAYFGGHAVYLYRDHWYYRDGNRWAYYQREPPALYRQRSYVQQAPPARTRPPQPPQPRRYTRPAPPVVR